LEPTNSVSTTGASQDVAVLLLVRLLVRLLVAKVVGSRTAAEESNSTSMHVENIERICEEEEVPVLVLVLVLAVVVVTVVCHIDEKELKDVR